MKSFDYELAYLMYKEVKYDLKQGGIDEVKLDFTECGDRANGYTSFYGEDYNTWVYVTNKNFDTELDDEWYVSGEVDIANDYYNSDTLFINNIKDINDRLDTLIERATKNNYTLKDSDDEKYSLTTVLDMIRRDSND